MTTDIHITITAEGRTFTFEFRNVKSHWDKHGRQYVGGHVYMPHDAPEHVRKQAISMLVERLNGKTTMP